MYFMYAYPVSHYVKPFGSDGLLQCVYLIIPNYNVTCLVLMLILHEIYFQTLTQMFTIKKVLLSKMHSNWQCCIKLINTTECLIRRKIFGLLGRKSESSPMT